MYQKIIIVLVFSFSCNFLFAQSPESLLFKRISEPNEKAFTILVPDGWEVSGGIQRVNPVNSGAANAIEAKLDFQIKKKGSPSLKIHWLPDMYYYDSRMSPAAAMFPEGSNYNGMLVLNKRKASDFVYNNLIPYYHPQAVNIQVQNENNAEALEELFKKYDRLPQLQMSYDAFVCDFLYSEKGTNYKERMLCVLTDMGPYTAGMWKNSNTVYFRAPVEEFQKWEAVFSVISQSVILNPEWLKKEIRGQIKRGEIMANTMQEINRIDQEIQQAHMKTNAEIHHQAFLTLTDQEDYVNPYSGEIETGSNQWEHRWVDDLGNVLYTDQDDYNPNLDIELNMSGFKPSKPKR